MIAFKQKGPVNCTVVGSPTIVGGVASGFSSTDYLNISSGYAFNFDTDFELQTKFIPTDVSSAAPLLVGNVATYGGLQLINGKIRFACRQRNTETTTTYTLSGTNNLEINHIYLANVKRVGNTLTLTIYKDGTLLETQTGSLTDILFVQNIANIRIGYTGTTGAFSGSIDLNETYIKVNGQPWFGVCTTPVSRVRLQGPVEYTVVGSPTIQNGIVSGFSTSNYLKSGGVFDFSHPFEVNISVKDFEGTGGSQYVFGLSAGSEGTLTHSLGMYHGGQATGLSMSYGSNQYWSSLAPTLTAHVPYTINLSSDGTTVTVKVTQGNNSKTSTKALSDFATTGTCELRLGLWATYGQVFTSGSIDLNETYVRVNGKLWFGKEPVQKIVKDGVTVWEEV